MDIKIATSKLSSQNQIVVPKAAREMWNLKEGNIISWAVDKTKATLQPRPESWTEYMSGLHKEIWKGVNIDKWLRKERKAWNR